MSRIQSWQRGAQLQASEPHSPASATTSRRPSAISPTTSTFDVRVMPAPPVPQVQVHVVEPRPVLHTTHSHVASLHSWDGASEDIESRAGLRGGDQDERSTLGRDKSWRARAARMSRAIFGPSHATPALPPWRALNVEKQPQPSQDEQTINVNVRAESQTGRNSHKCTCLHHKAPRRKRNRMFWCLLLILLILLAVADIIFLNVRVFNPNFIVAQPPASPTPTNLIKETVTAVPTTVLITSAGSTIVSVTTASVTTSFSTVVTPSATPSVLQNCLSQFQINAPSNPASYPCDTCFAALSGAPSSANAGPAAQFCAMKAIFDSAGSTGSAGSNALSGAGWMKDANPCRWAGVACDSSGSITTIDLTSPGVPAAMPSELSSIPTLTTLRITGDSNLPSGSLPSLPALVNLNIENTGISALSDGALPKSLASLVLVRNSKMGPALPSSVGSLSLQSLIVNGQSLTSFDPVFKSSSLSSSLQTLDLSSNVITGSLPSDLSAMSALAELNLSANDIAGPFPTSMPSKLQVLDLEGNPKLSGSLPTSLCSSTSLTQCDLKNTGLGASGTTCGSCTFA
ncbi:hypothetical protein FRC09_003304 [Ceratobasidium sp. 395]|nr:hypothetical protein FRC09_003304 [Ceratobasidium sp. 395]